MTPVNYLEPLAVIKKRNECHMESHQSSTGKSLKASLCVTELKKTLNIAYSSTTNVTFGGVSAVIYGAKYLGCRSIAHGEMNITVMLPSNHRLNVQIKQKISNDAFKNYKLNNKNTQRFDEPKRIVERK